MWAPAGWEADGCFTEVDYSKIFEYAAITDTTAFAFGIKEGATHLVFVNDQINWPYRYAKVKKTVVYMMLDEDEQGKPVWEKWFIKKHRVYMNGRSEC